MEPPSKLDSERSSASIVKRVGCAALVVIFLAVVGYFAAGYVVMLRWGAASRAIWAQSETLLLWLPESGVTDDPRSLIGRAVPGTDVVWGDVKREGNYDYLMSEPRKRFASEGSGPVSFVVVVNVGGAWALHLLHSEYGVGEGIKISPVRFGYGDRERAWKVNHSERTADLVVGAEERGEEPGEGR